jgi:hypothetical protein
MSGSIPQTYVSATPRALRSVARSAFGQVDVALSSVLINILSLGLPLVIL